MYEFFSDILNKEGTSLLWFCITNIFFPMGVSMLLFRGMWTLAVIFSFGVYSHMWWAFGSAMLNMKLKKAFGSEDFFLFFFDRIEFFFGGLFYLKGFVFLISVSLLALYPFSLHIMNMPVRQAIYKYSALFVFLWWFLLMSFFWSLALYQGEVWAK